MVASETGRCRRNDGRSRPGKEDKKPTLIAFCRVDKVGEKSAA